MYYQPHNHSQHIQSQQPMVEQEQIEAMDVQQNAQEDQHELQVNLLQEQELEQILQQNSQRMIDELNGQELKQQIVAVVKNPVSAYMMFIKSWKQKHPNEKFSVSLLGQSWKAMSLSQKEPYESQYRANKIKHDQYQAAMQINNPEKHHQEHKFLFPLHRVKAIMKQDPYYAPKVEATMAMAKSTQYFGQLMLEQLKKFSEGKSRLDAKTLFEYINNNKSLGFLQCLIEDYNKQNGDFIKQKKTKPDIELRVQNDIQRKPVQKRQRIVNKEAKVIKSNAKTQQKLAGQQSLDNFFNKG